MDFIGGFLNVKQILSFLDKCYVVMVLFFLIVDFSLLMISNILELIFTSMFMRSIVFIFFLMLLSDF